MVDPFDVSRLTEALVHEREMVQHYQSLLHLAKEKEKGGKAPAEIHEKLEAMGFTLYEEDIWQFTPEEGKTPYLVRIKTYPLFPREPSRKEIEAMLRLAGWSGYHGVWHNDKHKELNLREAYKAFRADC
jgi:hypothetical protein